MKAKSLCAIGPILLFVAAGAIADTKIVSLNHTDAYEQAGEQKPAKDIEYVYCFRHDRLRADWGSISFIVREDMQKMFIIYHVQEEYSEVPLPVDLQNILGQEASQQLLPLFTLRTTVTPLSETKTIGGWSASAYRVQAKSQLIEYDETIWVTKDAAIDLDAYQRLERPMLSLAFVGDYADAMKDVPGLTIASTGTLSGPAAGIQAMDTSFSTKWIDKVEPPGATYQVPENYKQVPFDYMVFSSRMD